ncbi:TPA: oligosaccharide flippase family protein, partial [Escherichia coli]
SEKIISIFGLFFVTSFVAKYIGPYRFGQIALSIAIFQVVQVISQMGCDNILFKRASKKKTSAISLIASTFHLRTFLYFVLSFFILCYFSITGDAISLIF